MGAVSCVKYFPVLHENLEAKDEKKKLRSQVSILGPLGYGPSTLPLRHFAGVNSSPHDKYIPKINRFVVYHRVFWLAGLHGQDGRACAISGEVGNSQICLTRESCK